MTAIITRLLDEPTGPNAGTLPILLPSTGVTDYTHRWSIKSIDPSVANGTKVTGWASAKGKLLTAASEATAPTVATSGGMRALAFDGSDDTLAVGDIGNVYGVTLVARVAAASGVNTGIWDGGSSSIGVVRTAGNSVGLFYNGGSATMTGAEIPNWSFVHAWFGSTGFLRINATTSGAVTPTSGSGPVTALRLGRNNTAFGNIAIAEVILWDRILDNTELATLRAALQVAYPSMVA